MKVLALLALAAALAACDAALPSRPPLVVEAFVETDRPLPDLRLARAGAAGPEPVADAAVTLAVGTSTVAFLAAPSEPGTYRPARPRPVRAGEPFVVEVRVGGEALRAASTAPAPLRLDSVAVAPAGAPVRAAFADALGGGIREGFVYPVDVALYWAAPPGADTSWVRARLRPPAAFPSAVVDLLLRTDDTRPEATLATEGGARVWRGVYAVPVEGPASPLPPHTLEVSVLRGGADYARFALSRAEPGVREPVGNVRGGLGIVAGVSVDRRTVAVGG